MKPKNCFPLGPYLFQHQGHGFFFALCLLATASTGWAQQTVYWRNNSGSTVWWDDDEGQRPWYYATANQDRNRPDLNAALNATGTANDLLFDNTYNLISTVNGASFAVNSITLVVGSGSSRTFNSDGGAIVLESYIANDSAVTHTFNVPISLATSMAEFRATGGNLIFNGAIATQGQTLRLTGGKTVTVGGAITDGSGSGRLEVTGNTTAVLTGDNSYSGGTSVDAGSSLSIGYDGSGGSLSNAGILDNAGTVIFSRTGTINYSGQIIGSGGVVKLESGNLTLSVANTFTGGVAYGKVNGSSAGILTFSGSTTGGPGNISSGPLGTGVFTLRNNGVSSNNYITSSDATARTISNAILFAGGSSRASFKGGGNFLFDGTVGLGGGGRTVEVSGIRVEFSGVVSSTTGGALVKEGDGTLLLSGSNTYAGGTTLRAGTLGVGHNSALSAGSLLIDSSGGVKTLASADGNGHTLGNAINLYNDLTLGQAAGGTGELALTGNIALGNEVGQNRILTVVGSHSIGGEISGARGLVKQGAGTLSLSGGNTFTGGLYLDSGSTRLTGGSLAGGIVDLGAGVLVQTGNAASMEIAASLTVDRSLTVKNFGTGAGDRSLIFSNPSGTATFSGLVALEKTLGVSSTGSGAWMSGEISGAGGLTKTGGGTLTLGGDNSYHGSTQVEFGKLLINGNQSTADGAVTVSSGATLGGYGTVGGATLVNGTHAPGNSPGVQSFAGDLSYGTTALFSWELDSLTEGAGDRGSQFDGVNVGGNLSIDAGSMFNIVLGVAFDAEDSFWKETRNWTVFDVTGSTSGLFSSFQMFDSSSPTSPVNYSQAGGFQYLPESGTLTWSAVPEPSSAMVAFLIAAGALRRKRRGKSLLQE